MKLINGDALQELKKLEDKSINLILIDPPYNIKKAKWDSWKTVDAYVEFMGNIFKELERVLKDNGSFYFFHNDFLQVAELQHWIRQNTKFVFKSFITIDKLDNKYIKDLYGSQEHFRNYLNFNEYALFYTIGKDETGLETLKRDENNFSSLKEYFRSEKEQIEKEINKELKEVLKWSTHFHWFAKGLMWRLPIEKHYITLQQTFEGHFKKPYIEIKEEYKREREKLKYKIEEYEAERYTFNETKGKETVWAYKFREEKKTLHPTQKPLKLLEDIIKASSNEGDTVLDCFLGSGSCGVAAVNTNRKFIGIELDPNYFEIAKKRIEEAQYENKIPR